MMFTVDLFGESKLTSVIKETLLNSFSVKTGRTKENLNVIHNIYSMET